MSQRHSTLDTCYRFAMGAYLFTLVLAMYAGTDNPTIHIKDLLTSWAAGLLAGSYLIATWIAGRPLRRPALFLELMLCLLGFFLLGTAFSEFFRYSLLETGQFFSLFALYWLASQIYTRPEQILRLFVVFCSAVFLAGLYALAQKANLDPFPWADRQSDTYTNLPATFGNPNYAAHAIILALIMIVCLVRYGFAWLGSCLLILLSIKMVLAGQPYIFFAPLAALMAIGGITRLSTFLRHEPKRTVILTLILFCMLVPVLLFHLYSTGQRAGWVALAGAAVLVALGYLLVRKTRRPLLATASTLLLFALAGISAVAGVMYLTQLRTGHLFPLDLSLLLRYQSYVSATNMVFASPILGHGPAVYSLAYPSFWTPYEQDWFAQELLVNGHVHNDLLELAIDGGLAAAGLYLAILILGMGYGLLLAARGENALQKRLGLTFAAFFAAFAIDGLFGFNLRVPVTAALFFVMAGVLDGLWSSAAAPDAPSARSGAWRLVLRGAFLVLLALSTWQATRRFVSEYYFFQATQAQEASNLDGATAAFQRAENYAPWSWEIPGYRGLLELDRKRPDLAQAFFKTALERNPHAFLTHLAAARANLMLAQAATERKDAGPDAAAALLDTARADVKAVLLIAPGLPSANDLLGRIESIAAIVSRDQGAAEETQRNHWEMARDYFQAAIDGGTREPAELYRMLARVETSLGDLNRAERALAAALRTEPGDGQTWKTFLEFARKHQRFAQMREVLYQTIDRLQGAQPLPEQQQQLAEAYGWLAIVQEEGFGDLQGTADALGSAVTWGPKRADLWSRYATFSQKQDRLPAFLEAIRKSCDALAARGEAPLPQVEAVNLAQRAPEANLDQASRTLLLALLTDANQSPLPILLNFGWAATLVQSIYDQQLNAGAAPCESALNLGMVAAKLGGLDLAAPLLERAAGCLEGEQRAAATVHWASTITRQGHPERALEILRAAQSEFPDYLDIQWGVARALAASGQLDEAKRAYAALIESAGLNAGAEAQVRRELANLDSKK